MQSSVDVRLSRMRENRHLDTTKILEELKEVSSIAMCENYVVVGMVCGNELRLYKNNKHNYVLADVMIHGNDGCGRNNIVTINADRVGVLVCDPNTGMCSIMVYVIKEDKLALYDIITTHILYYNKNKLVISMGFGTLAIGIECDANQTLVPMPLSIYVDKTPTNNDISSDGYDRVTSLYLPHTRTTSIIGMTTFVCETELPYISSVMYLACRDSIDNISVIPILYDNDGMISPQEPIDLTGIHTTDTIVDLCVQNNRLHILTKSSNNFLDNKYKIHVYHISMHRTEYIRTDILPKDVNIIMWQPELYK